MVRREQGASPLGHVFAAHDREAIERVGQQDQQQAQERVRQKP
jgi:hypothetical protein